ncbi:hypothetical protein [Brachybacterium sp. Z12]|uniref:hypothetical protein n=1 Tax=Brachybacterium sp. Z12 TaxID=2759167 RepID=UPI00223BFAA5|nr:hypothetical protein [Brachybacterium sp. Z12]
MTARLLEDPQERASARFWRAEALDVLEAGPDRAPSVWEEAGIDGVGGAEWAHIALPAQRRIASEVMQELLRRAGVSSFPIEQVQVEPAPHDAEGLAWRTRVRYAVDEEGRVGMRGWRSHEVRPVGDDPLSAQAIRDLRLGDWIAPEGTEAIDAVAPSAGPASVVLIGRDLDPNSVEIPDSWGDADVAVRTSRGLVTLRGDGTVHERVGERLFTVSATGFWQSHRRAADLLTEVVQASLGAPAGAAPGTCTAESGSSPPSPHSRWVPRAPWSRSRATAAPPSSQRRTSRICRRSPRPPRTSRTGSGHAAAGSTPWCSIRPAAVRVSS